MTIIRGSVPNGVSRQGQAFIFVALALVETCARAFYAMQDTRTPLIASLSEDALRAVPRGLREGAFAMAATRYEVVRRVVLPAALSGIMASIILAMSRAVGETMAVVLAMSFNPQLTINPLDQGGTMAAFIAQITAGDTPQDSLQFKALFAVAFVLFLMTLGLNLISNRIVARFRNRYS